MHRRVRAAAPSQSIPTASPTGSRRPAPCACTEPGDPNPRAAHRDRPPPPLAHSPSAARSQ
ncbi:polygalacturonase [Iris pallida]|uniref:Polygalacturonase n=1 Tax=Iris pallida TaxID=29817 RepID=A0AAX6F1Z7_IRIPA|nr:polygalacturonase [Iris pallida]